MELLWKSFKDYYYHLIIVNDISDAGEYNNSYTIKFNENKFQYIIYYRILKERFITLSKDYFE